MKIVVLAGSPKGRESVTVEFVRYLEKRFPHHTFDFRFVAHEYRRYEYHPDAFNTVVDNVANADLVLWAFPLYYFLVSSGYKRFIELIFERKKADAFRGHYAAALTTSIHFYDHTAHNYIHAVSEDLGMRFLGGLPAEMHDLFDDSTREQIVLWFSGVIDRVESGDEPTRSYARLPRHAPRYPHSDHPEAGEFTARGVPPSIPAPLGGGTSVSPGPRPVGGRSVSPGPRPVGGTASPSHRIAIVTDSGDENTRGMVSRIRRSFPDAAVVDLATMRFGHCMGCLKCGFDNRCAYDDTKDEFRDTFTAAVLPADAVVFALSMRDRYFTSLWQRYLE